MPDNTPTERELDILKILWAEREATVREVYEIIREDVPIVQNTVQAMLRTMEEKGLVEHRIDGRAFVYRPTAKRERTTRNMIGKMLDQAFDGAVDQLVESLFSHRKPNADELARLQELIDQHQIKMNRRKKG